MDLKMWKITTEAITFISNLPGNISLWYIIILFLTLSTVDFLLIIYIYHLKSMQMQANKLDVDFPL